MYFYSLELFRALDDLRNWLQQPMPFTVIIFSMFLVAITLLLEWLWRSGHKYPPEPEVNDTFLLERISRIVGKSINNTEELLSYIRDTNRLKSKADTHIYYVNKLTDHDVKSLPDVYRFITETLASLKEHEVMLDAANSEIVRLNNQSDDDDYDPGASEASDDDDYDPGASDASEEEDYEPKPLPVSQTMPTIYKALSLMTCKQLMRCSTADSKLCAKRAGYRNKEKQIFAVCLDMRYDPAGTYQKLTRKAMDELPLSIAKRELCVAFNEK